MSKKARTLGHMSTHANTHAHVYTLSTVAVDCRDGEPNWLFLRYRCRTGVADVILARSFRNMTVVAVDNCVVCVACHAVIRRCPSTPVRNRYQRVYPVTLVGFQNTEPNIMLTSKNVVSSPIYTTLNGVCKYYRHLGLPHCFVCHTS